MEILKQRGSVATVLKTSPLPQKTIQYYIQIYTLSFLLDSTYLFVFGSIKTIIDNPNKANWLHVGERRKQLECTK